MSLLSLTRDRFKETSKLRGGVELLTMHRATRFLGKGSDKRKAVKLAAKADRAIFVEMFGRGGPVVSDEALTLHIRAVRESVRRATLGHIADGYLDELGSSTSIAAAELCLAGVWERVSDGYRSMDQDYLEQVVSILEQADKKRWRLGRDGRALARLVSRVQLR